MGGAGSRFKASGYREDKAEILVTDRHRGNKVPMIIASMQDLPGVTNKNNTLICVDREKHEKNGTEKLISDKFTNVEFIHDNILLDQAYACFLAKEHLQSDEELLIGNCDSGLNIDVEYFEKMKIDSDVIIFSQHQSLTIEENPDDHSWILTERDNVVTGLSIKKSISASPRYDHATTGIFWFKKASVFLHFLEQMINSKDTLNNKYYVDKIINYYLKENLKVRFLDVEYFCWGTPKDYESYEKTFQYWKEFHLV